MGVFVFLIVGFLAVVVFILGFPLLQSGTQAANSQTGNMSANATAWTGLSGTYSLYPLFVGMILVGFIAFGVWIHFRGKSK